uniref:Uncharacterized protein n=1 Tax=Anguilla anguilla TaxID=7936 RepID=A0A0E9PMS5_ANGAN
MPSCAWTICIHWHRSLWFKEFVRINYHFRTEDACYCSQVS